MDKGEFSYKQSFDQNSEINNLVENVFKKKKIKFKKYKFVPQVMNVNFHHKVLK